MQVLRAPGERPGAFYAPRPSLGGVTGGQRSERWSVEALHGHFCDGLGHLLATRPAVEALRTKPLDLETRTPLPPRLRLYLFNGTDHPSERKPGDYRIQLRLPGQRHQTRGQLAAEPGTLLLVAGYVPEFDVYVLWDARAHEEFPYSKGVQVGATTVHEAAIRGLAEQQRNVRSRGVLERVVAVRTDRLVEGLVQRERLSRQTLLQEHTSAAPGREGPAATTTAVEDGGGGRDAAP